MADAAPSRATPSHATPPRTVLVIGGTGAFGERLVAGLLDRTALRVVAAGRDAGRLAALRTRLGRAAPDGSPRLDVLALDSRRLTPEALRATGAFAVVDAAGPFQGADHRVARAAIAAGLHSLDLADARDFVAGFGALDAAARAAGVVALTGASSTPALSDAALTAITAGWRRIDRVEVAIAPGNRAPRGLSVVRAILGYAGRPVRVFEDGAWRRRPGWGMTRRSALPGLGHRWLSLAETPDLDLLPVRHGVRDAVLFRAGLELSVLHLGLLAASLPVRAGWPRSLAPLARPVRAMATLLAPFGSDRGGMLVEATGRDADDRPARARWSLVAEAGDGPFVPSLPALALLRALEAGRPIPPGAGPCVGVLSLGDIEAEFAGRRIAGHRAVEHPPPSLYARVLGPGFAALPSPLRRLHDPGWGLRASGQASVEGAEGRLARLVAAAFRLPPAAERVPVRVDIRPCGAGERWVRDFGGRRFASTLSPAGPDGLEERFGPFRFRLALRTGPGGVEGMPVLGWRLGPLPLPRALAPVSLAREAVDGDGRFCFDVEMRLPLGLGRLVRYRGWLVPDP